MIANTLRALGLKRPHSTHASRRPERDLHAARWGYMHTLPLPAMSRCAPSKTAPSETTHQGPPSDDAPCVSAGRESIIYVSGHEFTTVPRGELHSPAEHAHALCRHLRQQPPDYGEYCSTDATFHLAAPHEYAVEKLAPILEAYRLMCLERGWQSHGWRAVAKHFNPLTAPPRVGGKRRPAKAYGGPSHNRYRIYHIPPLREAVAQQRVPEPIRRAA